MLRQFLSTYSSSRFKLEKIMSKKGGYTGGSTVIHSGSGWFSRPEPGVDPESGETRAEHIRRLAAEVKKHKALKEKTPQKKKKKSSQIQRPQPDLEREKRHAQYRAEAAERISKVSVEVVRKKRTKASDE